MMKDDTQNPVAGAPFSPEMVRMIALIDEVALGGCAWWFQDATKAIRRMKAPMD